MCVFVSAETTSVSLFIIRFFCLQSCTTPQHAGLGSFRGRPSDLEVDLKISRWTWDSEAGSFFPRWILKCALKSPAWQYIAKSNCTTFYLEWVFICDNVFSKHLPKQRLSHIGQNLLCFKNPFLKPWNLKFWKIAARVQVVKKSGSGRVVSSRQCLLLGVSGGNK